MRESVVRGQRSFRSVSALLIACSVFFGASQINAENDGKVTVEITSPTDGTVIALQDLPVTIKSSFGLPAFVDLTVNGTLVFEKQPIGAMEAITLTVLKANLVVGKNTLQAEAYYMKPDDDGKYGKFKTEKITVTVPKKPKK